MSNEKTNEKKIDIFAILEQAESTPKEARTVRVSSAKKTTLFKSSLYKKGQRTETSLIDDAIVEAVKSLYSAGKTEVSYYALTKLFEALNPNHRFKSVTRIPDHIEAKKEIFDSFFEITPNKLVFKDSIIVALGLENNVEKSEVKPDKAEKKVETKLRKKA